jgi:hypothetical protein
MDTKDRIYVAPKRGQLPYRYRMGLDRPNYNWRHASIAITVCALIGIIAWLVLR